MENNYPRNLLRELQAKMKTLKKKPKRKRKLVEIRPSEKVSMKRKHPEFGYHKDYIHPWSLYQKGCALQYRQLTYNQKQQLQLQGLSKTKSPLRIKWKSPGSANKGESPVNLSKLRRTRPTKSKNNFFNSNNSPQKKTINKSYNSLVMNKPPTKGVKSKIKKLERIQQINILANKLLKEKFSSKVARKVAMKMLNTGRPSTNYVKSSGKTKQ